jgi:histidinol dehydrogenase
MNVRRFEWEGPGAHGTARAIRAWASEQAPPVDVAEIEREVREDRDAALLRLTARFDATEQPPPSLTLRAEDFAGALDEIGAGLRESLEVAAANIKEVAAAQLGAGSHQVELPQGQTVTVGRAPVRSAGIYAPGGKAAYPSSVLMGCIPARAAGVLGISLATPPKPDGSIDPLVLAAAELCEVDRVHPVGGAQAIFALAYGTESVSAVDVIAGPGNRWVTEAKRAVYGQVGIDSLAGPSELMLVADRETDPEWAALDLCAQAEHGGGGLLLAVAGEDPVLDGILAAAERIGADRPGLAEAPLALLRSPDDTFAPVDLANALAPEHLELLAREAIARADQMRTAGCVFVGPWSATAFGDYVAGSNHILPTGGSGRFSGPLSPDVFRRSTASVEVSAAAAAKLAPHARALAEAEGFPLHGESAMIRAKDA